MDYFHDLYDLATDFGIEVEGHRRSLLNFIIHSKKCRWVRTRGADELQTLKPDQVSSRLL